jgi:DNA-binding SARP family transcriptional activator
VHFNLLGPLSVHDDEGPVELRGDLRRTLLAVLLLHAGAPVSVDRLAECLWGLEGADADPARLYNHVTRLRLVLAGGGERIRAVPPGYQIRVEPGELDLHVFAAECAAGRRKLAEKAWAEASRHFGAALGLWRGRPLADIPALAEDPRIRELEEAHLRALQGRIEAELNLGRHHELLDELRALTETHPRHEAFRSQLMLALHRAGQSGDATTAYEAYRESLLDELGLEPGAELRELHEAVSRADPALLLAPKPNAPRQLPADTRVFTGRARELAELVAAAGQAAGTLVISALDGMAGIGKTALAVRAAHRVADRFPDGQLFIDLRGNTGGLDPLSAEDALAYLLRALGVAPQSIPSGVAERTTLYRAKLAEHRTLIVLDNAVGPDQVRPLLPGVVGCLVLITSRNRLTGLDGALSLTLDLLSEGEAVALLSEVAGTEKAPLCSPAVRELAALCGYVPLALRIVAARLRHQRELTVDALVSQMRDETGRLGQLNDGDRDLTSVFDSAFASLPEPERDMLRMLGVIPGPDLDPYAAANLLGTDLHTARHLLESLLERSLLLQQTAGRYRMHDLIRAYVRSLMDADGDEARGARARLLDYCERTAWRADVHVARNNRTQRRATAPAPATASPAPELSDTAQALAWFRAERPNLLAAIADAATAPAARIGLTAAMASTLMHDGPWQQAAALHEAAVRAAGELGDRQAEAEALWDQARTEGLLLTDGRGYATSLLERSLSIFQEIGDRQGEANVRSGIRALEYGDGDAAAAALGSDGPAAPIFREVGDRLGEAGALYMEAKIFALRGEPGEAHRLGLEALAAFREVGLRRGEAMVLHTLGRLDIDEGDLSSAAVYLESSIAIHREFGHRQNEAAVLLDLGRIRTVTGAYARAAEMISLALETFRDLGSVRGQAVGVGLLGQVRLATGEYAAAEKLFDEATALYLGYRSRYGEVDTLRDLGITRFRAGDPSGTDALERALEAFDGEVQDAQGEARTLVYLGEAAAETEGPARALDFYRQAIPLARKARSLIDEAHALDGIARCTERLGDRRDAVENLGQAVARYRRMGAFELAEAEARLTALESAESGGAGAVSQPPAAEVS